MLGIGTVTHILASIWICLEKTIFLYITIKQRQTKRATRFTITVKIGYNKLSYNEHSLTTNEYFGPKFPFATQINPVITNPGYNEPRL